MYQIIYPKLCPKLFHKNHINAPTSIYYVVNTIGCTMQ